MRAFVAFELPGRIIDRTNELQRALMDQGLKMRWVKPQNLHLTLRFLGDIPEADVPRIGLAIKAAVEDESALELTIQGMGVFPGIKRPRVLWVGLGGQIERLRQLHRRLEDQLAQVGYTRDKRGFKAHLTIARAKSPVAPDLLLRAINDAGEFTPLSFSARKMVLFKSDLRPQGAVYTRLAEAQLV